MVYWLNRDEINVMAGRCYTELCQPKRAEPLLRDALDRYNEELVRETSLYSSWLAESYVHAGVSSDGRLLNVGSTCSPKTSMNSRCSWPTWCK
jgi:hypothetical protein